MNSWSHAIHMLEMSMSIMVSISTCSITSAQLHLFNYNYICSVTSAQLHLFPPLSCPTLMLHIIAYSWGKQMSQLGRDLALFCRANGVLDNEMLGRAHYMGSLTKGFHPTRKFLVQNYTVTADGRSRHSLSTEKNWVQKGAVGISPVVIYILFVGCVVKLYYFHETASPPRIQRKTVAMLVTVVILEKREIYS